MNKVIVCFCSLCFVFAVFLGVYTPKKDVKAESLALYEFYMSQPFVFPCYYTYTDTLEHERNYGFLPLSFGLSSHGWFGLVSTNYVNSNTGDWDISVLWSNDMIFNTSVLNFYDSVYYDTVCSNQYTTLVYEMKFLAYSTACAYQQGEDYYTFDEYFTDTNRALSRLPSYVDFGFYDKDYLFDLINLYYTDGSFINGSSYIYVIEFTYLYDNEGNELPIPFQVGVASPVVFPVDVEESPSLDWVNRYAYELNTEYGADVFSISNLRQRINIGLNADYDNGYNNGFDEGYDSGLSTGFNDGFDEGYDSGLSTGFDNGYTAGYNDAVNLTLDDLTPFQTIVNAVNNFLRIELFNGVSIGLIIQLALGVTLLGVFIKIFLGG